jgi:hypothetical protein
MSLVVSPSAPTITGASAQTSPLRVTIIWKINSLNATYFIIQRATNTAFTANLVTFTTTGVVTSYVDSTVVAGNTYYYRVIAANLVGDTVVYAAPAIGYPNMTAVSVPSNSVTLAPPAAPSNLVVTQPGVRGTPVILTWRDNSSSETAFTVQRGPSATGPWITLSTTVPAVPGTGGTGTYSNTGVSPLTTYYYQVMATSALGASAPTPQTATTHITTK